MSAKPLEPFPVYVGTSESDDPVATRRRERRKRQRTHLHWPVRLFRNSGEGVVETTTRNLSSDGFYCTTTVEFTLGEPMHCILRLPAHDPGGQMLSLQCRVHVVRVDPANGDGLYGLACRIEDYHFVHTSAPRVQ